MVAKSAKPGTQTGRQVRREPPLLTVDEAIAAYPGEWLLMETTELDANRNPARGRILVHARTDKPAWRVFKERLRAQGQPAMPYYVFAAYPRVRDGSGLLQLLEDELREANDDTSG